MTSATATRVAATTLLLEMNKNNRLSLWVGVASRIGKEVTKSTELIILLIILALALTLLGKAYQLLVKPSAVKLTG